MFLIENNNITITKGDSGKINLRFKNGDGSEYIPQKTDEIIFSVKRRKEKTSEIILEKRGSEIFLKATETEIIPSGEYFYDVCIKKGEDERCTAIEGKFTIRKAVHNFE